MIEITIDETAIHAFVNDINGPVARELEVIVLSEVEPAVQDALSTPGEFTMGRNGPWYRRHPPEPLNQVNPWMRSARLWSSVGHQRPTTAGGIGLHCDVTVEAFNEGHDYAQTLINRGYIFVKHGDARFQIVDTQ